MSTRENKNNHKYFMNLAFNQARKIQGNTGENPSVGVVIVKNGSVFRLAHTNFNGRPHAEQIALKGKENFKGSTLYSTLEPCNHFGKSPPCTDLIIKKGIKKVFFSSFDPDKRTFNKSKKILSKKRIYTVGNLLKFEGNSFYKDFIIKNKSKNIFIASKLATSKDFFVCNKKNRWITNEYSRLRVHLLRSKFDSIMSTSKTILEDNSILNCRVNGLEKTSPTRIILDKNLEIKTSSNICSTAKRYKTIFFYNLEKIEKLKKLRSLKIKTIKINLEKNHLDFNEVIKCIKKIGIKSVLVESGIKFNKFLLDSNLLNDFYHFYTEKHLKRNGIYNAKSFFLRLNKIKKKREKIIVNLLDDKLDKYIII